MFGLIVGSLSRIHEINRYVIRQKSFANIKRRKMLFSNNFFMQEREES
jgi:hypothetical protein